MGCRGEFDIDQYLVGDDEASTSESGSTSESESGDVTGESTESSSTDSSSTDSTSTESTSTESSTTDAECLDGQFDLGGRCLSIANQIDLGPNPPNDLELGDFDNNRSLDVALSGNQVSFRLNTGVGDFGPPQYVTGPGAANIAVGDLDGDSQLDLATFAETNVNLYHGSNNNFVYDTSLALIAADGVIVEIDGFPGHDLVLSGASLRVVLSSNGTFAIVDDLPYLGSALGLVNLNGDSRKDVMLAMPPMSAVAAFTNDGMTMSSPMAQVLGVSISGIASLDVDDDGIQEVLMTATDGRLYVYASDNFGMPLAAILVGNFPVALATGDLDGDGLKDVATANGEGGDIAVLLNQGGTFGPPISIATSNANDIPNSIAIGDLDGDNLEDIVVGMINTNRLVVFL